MRVAVVGGGAIGVLVAAAAVASGHEVVLGVRSPLDRVVVEREGRPDELVPVAVATSPEEAAGPADVLFLAVKATDTASAAGWLHLVAPGGLVAVVQNGLDQEARVAPFLPSGVEAAAALAYIGAERIAQGRVRHFSGNLLMVASSHRDRVAAAVGGEGAPPAIRVTGSDDMLTESWRKLLANAVANPITALTMRRIDVMAEPAVADLARVVLGEALAVARASGARLTDGEIERIVEGTGRYGPATGSSMLYDRMAGRPMEHQFLTGEVVRRGRELGIAVPVNEAILVLLDALDRSRPD